MKNITLSAEESVIKRARQRARLEHTTINAMFRHWLASYANRDKASTDYQALMDELSYAQAGQIFTRDELNER